MTPEQVAALSACWRCIPDFRAALLFLLATNAGMTLEQVIAQSACWRCVVDFQAAELFLLNSIATSTAAAAAAAAAAAGQVTCGATDPVAPPTGACALYFQTVSQALYAWDGAAWILKV